MKKEDTDKRMEQPAPRKRIQLDFSPEGYNKLLSIARKSGEHRTYVEVVRSALGFYDWFLVKKSEGYKFSIEKDGVSKEVAFVG